MVIDLRLLMAALPHIVSGLTLSCVAYIARRTHIVYQVYKKLPKRTDELEKKIGDHETRITRLEIPVVR